MTLGWRNRIESSGLYISLSAATERTSMIPRPSWVRVYELKSRISTPLHHNLPYTRNEPQSSEAGFLAYWNDCGVTFLSRYSDRCAYHAASGAGSGLQLAKFWVHIQGSARERRLVIVSRGVLLFAVIISTGTRATQVRI